jgi:serine/alanine adding enzyme
MIVATSPVAVSRRFTLRTDLPREECQRYLGTRPAATSYHDRDWLTVIERAFRHEVLCLAADTPGGLAGVLPLVFFRSRLFGRFAVSLPFVNYGGIVADDAKAARALLDAAIAHTMERGGTHLELRHKTQLFPELAAKRHKVAMVLPLAGSVEQQWAGLDKKVRNQIRKAEKNELTGKDGGAELLADFYTVFATNMRDLGTPVYTREFFREVLATFPTQARVFCVYFNGQPIAASIVHWRSGTIEVPWASSLRTFNPLCANVYLYWLMLRFAIERGFRRFDFGRSTPGEGTYHFKKQWGAAAEELVWEYWTAAGREMPALTNSNPKFQRAIRAWQRLPVTVATALGPSIVRNIP